MTASTAVAELREAANAKQAPVLATDEWLHGASEPTDPGQAETRRRIAAPALAPYVPVPVPLMGGARWPLILVEGPEYTGKTTYAFKLAGSGLVGRTYVLAVGEDVDEFKVIAPDAMRLPHNGTWHQIMGCVEYVAEQARLALEAGEAPVLFLIDSMTKIWQLLSEWAEKRAAAAPSNREKLAADPNEEIDTHPLFWTAANRRHERLVTRLITMPAIVVVTARSGLKTEMVNGKPTKNMIYKVEAQKMLGYSTTAWVRVSLDQHPTIIGLRRPAGGGIQPNARGAAGKAVVVDPNSDRFKGVDFSLEWLLTHVMKFDPAKARTSTIVEPVADSSAEPVSAPPAPPAAPGASELAGAGPDGTEVRPAQTRQSEMVPV